MCPSGTAGLIALARFDPPVAVDAPSRGGGGVGYCLTHTLSIPAGTLVGMEPSEKTRENRLRRMAARQGFAFRKTRRLDHRAADFGTYTLTPAKGKPRTFGTVDDLEEFLTR